MGNLTAKTSGELASFMTPAKTNIKSLKVHFSPKQLGTGDPSPENVREIVGWDGVEVNGSGKNIAHIVGYSAQNSDSKNSRSISNSYGTTINTTEFSLPDTKLIITQTQSPNTSVPQGYQNGYIAVLVDNLVWGQKYNISFKIDNIISNPLNVSSTNLKLLIPKGDSYSSSGIQDNRVLFKNVLWQPYPNTNVNRRNFEIRICGMSFTLSEFMVTPADEDDFDFEPYQGDINITNWSSEIGTVYGGYVDLISGELENIYGIYTFEENGNYEYRAGSVTYVIPTVLDMKIGDFYTDQYVVCNRAKKVLYRSPAVNNELQIKIGNGNNRAYLYNTVGTIGIDNETDFRQWVKDNPISFTYPLIEPVVYQLTPTQLSSFIGQNNFWSNADYVEIEYDLIETEDIQKARKKIILNQPHVESAIDDVANFTTNMKAPLKECKVYFSPIQEGSGDPSPDNVRNIIGWDGVNVNKCGKNLVNVSDETRAYSYVGGSATNYTENNNTIIISGVSNGGYLVSCKPNTQYTYSCEPALRSGGVYLRVWELEEKYNGKEIPSGHLSVNQNVNSAAGSVVTFTTKANTHYLVVGFYIYSTAAETGLTISDFQLELGDTRTSYEPHQGTTTSVSWSDSIGTVYGGYVDLAKGELVATHKFVIYNGQEDGWNTYRISQQIHFTRIISDKKIKMNSSISNLFPNANNIAFWDMKEYSIFGDHYTLPRIYVNAPYEMPDGVTEWKEWLSANPLQVCYELAEPIHYSLTPQQLLTFKGENNIWSDSNGQIEVKFWTH